MEEWLASPRVSEGKEAKREITAGQESNTTCYVTEELRMGLPGGRSASTGAPPLCQDGAPSETST